MKPVMLGGSFDRQQTAVSSLKLVVLLALCLVLKLKPLKLIAPQRTAPTAPLGKFLLVQNMPAAETGSDLAAVDRPAFALGQTSQDFPRTQ